MSTCRQPKWLTSMWQISYYNGMYKVRYYLTAGTFTSKIFKTFSEAMLFSVWQVKTGDVYSIDKV